MLAPAVWTLCGVGFDQDLTGRARDDGGIESLTGVLLLVLAGAAYAILLFSPISPLGPLLAGLAFTGVGAWARLAPESYAGVWPANVAKGGFDLSTPGYGLAVLLAVPLLGTALSARRWRAFEPPEILLIGTIGRARGAARVAGTPMASERTTVIPQQRRAAEFVPGFGAPSADTTQIVGPGRQADDPTIAVPLGRPRAAFNEPRAAFDEPRAAFDEDGEERTTVMQLGRPPAASPAPTSPAPTSPAPTSPAPTSPAPFAGRDEPTQLVTPAGRAADSDDRRTEDFAAMIRPFPGADSADGEATRNVASDDTVRSMTAAAATPPAAEEDTTRDVVAGDASRGGAAGVVTGDETTRLVLPAGAGPQAADAGAGANAATSADAGLSVGEDPEDRTQVLTLPKADGRAAGGPDRGEQTQVIRGGTVEPPGDRTQLLTFPTPGEATTVPVAHREAETSQEIPESTKAMSIVAAERPDPGEDPTTRLTTPAEQPGEETPRSNPERAAATVTSIERPADEAADDTRPLTLPAPRPPAEDETTRLI
ncbi:hypothetical protein DMB66_44315 [Actinoplanes sp. ATCC 53533]|nr:hypothetical protein DMB66_44315 [Actinoplanes sp. ATCC 53533]